MRRFGKYEPGEEDLPEGWDPEQEQDPRWDGIKELMKRADDPAMPPQSRFEAMRIETRRQLLEEGKINLADRPRAELRFRDWLRVLAAGGGLGAQSLRLGFVGSCAFLLGLQFIAEPPALDDLKTDGAENVAATAPADQPDSDLYANSGRIRSVSKSFQDQENSGPTIQNIPVGGGWYYNNAMNREVKGTAVSAEAAGFRVGPDNLATQALNQVQVLKFNFLVNEDSANLAEVRKLEKTLQQMMEQMQQVNAPETEAVRLYRRAEQFIAARRYSEAQESLERIINIYPGSSYAFVSQFQIGAVAFERTHDYELALESFRRCLTNYQASVVPDQHRRYLEDRVRVLQETAGEQWKSVRTWQSLEETRTTQEAMEKLVSIVRDSQSPLLVSEAAIRLKDLLIADTVRGELNYSDAVDALEARMGSMQASPEMARVQLALADITLRRTQNPGKALDEYRRVFLLQPDIQTCSAAEARINSLQYLISLSPMN
jgi:tetratricopeptide (TPR) repeat protein